MTKSTPIAAPKEIRSNVAVGTTEMKAAAVPACLVWRKKVEALSAALCSERKQKRKLAEENEAVNRKVKFLAVDAPAHSEGASGDTINLVAKCGSSIACSRFLLAQRSAVLKVTMLLREDVSKLFCDVELEVLSLFLLYLETATLCSETLPQRNVELLKMAINYEVHELREVCLEHLLHSYPRIVDFAVDYETASENAIAILHLWDEHKDIAKLKAISSAVTESFIGFRLLKTLGGDDNDLETKVDTMKASVLDILEENTVPDGVACGMVKGFVWKLEECKAESD